MSVQVNLCERSSLVGEDVLDLTEFLVESGCPRLGRRVLGRVVHVTVPVDPQTVDKPDHLHTGSTPKHTPPPQCTQPDSHSPVNVP